ncbi:YisL family protein [Pseudalkalibacillus caeni]|uniref:DUF1516 family protein n=1 Tax=Exobacillus caeni TaxID=2574798 RepID=A0A5R9F654_9BACL|nr:YisL family protein [Pseudalkalibacillus caeni]TLS37870.1 DUF1516 family protein [Pseudalkalibacillus caeni]
MLHAHYTAWVLTLILFFVSYFLLRLGKEKGQKITHMILRLFYILTLISGIVMVVDITAAFGFYGPVYIKAALAIWLLTSMEMVLVKGKNGKSTTVYWIQLVIAFALVLFYGYSVLHIYTL